MSSWTDWLDEYKAAVKLCEAPGKAGGLPQGRVRSSRTPQELLRGESKHNNGNHRRPLAVRRDDLFAKGFPFLFAQDGSGLPVASAYSVSGAISTSSFQVLSFSWLIVNARKSPGFLNRSKTPPCLRYFSKSMIPFFLSSKVTSILYPPR